MLRSCQCVCVHSDRRLSNFEQGTRSGCDELSGHYGDARHANIVCIPILR